MSNLAKGFETFTNNLTTSDKGDVAYKSTLSPLVDLYAAQGALRGRDDEYVGLLEKAAQRDAVSALALLFKLRDIRNGVGERDLFRAGLQFLENRFTKMPLGLVLKYGRVDDLFSLQDKGNLADAADLLIENIKTQTEYSSLVAKWLPRKAKTDSERYVLNLIRKGLKWTPKQLRKWCVEHANTVEQLISLPDGSGWGKIDYNKVPSQAMHKHRGAFQRHDEERFTRYIEELTKPAEERNEDVKINAGTLYPYQLLNQGIYQLDETKCKLIIAQWEALPDFLNGYTGSILPMIDVSGSMNVPASDSKVRCLDAAVSLGIYLAQRNQGKLKDSFLTFHYKPSIISIGDCDNVVEAYKKVSQSPWGMNTDLDKAFTLLLEMVKQKVVTNDDLPDTVMILSDMNFDEADNHYQTKYNSLKALYSQEGVKFPNVVYWNLNHNGTFACKLGETGVCEISGFSPAIVKDVLGNIDELTPEGVYLRGIDSYLEEVKDWVASETKEGNIYPVLNEPRELDIVSYPKRTRKYGFYTKQFTTVTAFHRPGLNGNVDHFIDKSGKDPVGELVKYKSSSSEIDDIKSSLLILMKSQLHVTQVLDSLINSKGIDTVKDMKDLVKGIRVGFDLRVAVENLEKELGVGQDDNPEK